LSGHVSQTLEENHTTTITDEVVFQDIFGRQYTSLGDLLDTDQLMTDEKVIALYYIYGSGFIDDQGDRESVIDFLHQNSLSDGSSLDTEDRSSVLQYIKTYFTDTLQALNDAFYDEEYG
jgi:hypothetical protein